MGGQLRQVTDLGLRLAGLKAARTTRAYDGPDAFRAAITHEGAWQVARCLEVEVASQGETVEEALANLREALELYFEDEVLPERIEPPIIATIELSA